MKVLAQQPAGPQADKKTPTRKTPTHLTPSILRENYRIPFMTLH